MEGCSPIAVARSSPSFAEAPGYLGSSRIWLCRGEIGTLTAATSLLDFILNLLKDPQAQAEFRASPEHVLAANGLTGVCAADIHDVLPLVTDNRFVELTSSHATSPSVVPTAGDNGVHAAIQYLRHITCTYRYDDHGAHGTDLGHVNIWALGDVPQTFDDSHVVTGGPGTPSAGGAPGTGTWGDGHGNSGHDSNLSYGDHSSLVHGDTQDGPAGSWPRRALPHAGHDQGDDLHSFGSGAAMTSAVDTGSPAAYSGDTFGSHDSTGFRPAHSGGAALAGPDDYHAHDAHNSLGDDYYGHDSYYGQDTDGTHDAQEPHIHLDLH